MVASKVRLKRLEQEQRFQDWLFSRRLFETLPEREFAFLVAHGYFLNPVPPLKSSLDGLDRKSLTRRLAVRLYWMWRNQWDYQQLKKFGPHLGQPGTGVGVK